MAMSAQESHPALSPGTRIVDDRLLVELRPGKDVQDAQPPRREAGDAMIRLSGDSLETRIAPER
jgi:hypothetical protein